MKHVSPLSDGELDDPLLRQVQGGWVKASRMAPEALSGCKNRDERRIFARMAAFREGGRIECAGNAGNGRFRVVRLPVSF